MSEFDTQLAALTAANASLQTAIGKFNSLMTASSTADVVIDGITKPSASKQIATAVSAQIATATTSLSEQISAATATLNTTITDSHTAQLSAIATARSELIATINTAIAVANAADYLTYSASAVCTLPGFILKTTGGLLASAGYFASDFLPVLPLFVYTVYGAQTGNVGYAVYDKNKIFISGGQTMLADGVWSATASIPSNGYYLRTSYAPAAMSTASVVSSSPHIDIAQALAVINAHLASYPAAKTLMADNTSIESYVTTLKAGLSTTLIKSQLTAGNLPGGAASGTSGQGSIVPTVDATLNALGISYVRTLSTLSVLQDSYATLYPPHRYQAGDRVYVSCYVMTDDWANVTASRARALLYPASGTNQVAPLSYVDVTPNIRRYYTSAVLASQHMPVSRVMIEITAAAGRQGTVHVSGYTAAFSHVAVGGVDYLDFDPFGQGSTATRLTALEATVGAALAHPKLLLPKNLYLVTNRSVKFWRSHVSEYRDSNRMDIAFVGAAAGRQCVQEFDYSATIDGSMLSGDGAIWARTTDDSSAVYRRQLMYHSAAPVTAGSPKILVIGDSLTQQGTVSALASRLQADGLTPVFLGTLQDNGGTWCEGRAAWEFSDYTRKHLFSDPSNPITGGSTPLYPIDATGGDGVVTTVEQYLALPGVMGLPVRWKYNPFIRPSVGGDNPDHVKNGYIFDMRFYLTRFAYPDPDIVMIALGTNDQNSNAIPAGYNNCVEGLAILHAQIRAALPSAKIGIVASSYPDKDKFESLSVPWINHLISNYDTPAANNTSVLPVYAAQHTKYIYPMTVGATNAAGVESGVVGDWVHFDDIGRGQWADVTYAWVVNQL